MGTESFFLFRVPLATGASRGERREGKKEGDSLGEGNPNIGALTLPLHENLDF